MSNFVMYSLWYIYVTDSHWADFEVIVHNSPVCVCVSAEQLFYSKCSFIWLYKGFNNNNNNYNNIKNTI